MGNSEDLIYVPGEWRCKECGFGLHKRLLSAQTGEVGIDTKEVTETCPNDGFILQPVTWKETAEELGSRLQEVFKHGSAKDHG